MAENGGAEYGSNWVLMRAYDGFLRCACMGYLWGSNGC